MDVAFCESLTGEEACQFLSRLLDEEKAVVENLLAAAKTAGLLVDYSIDSLVPLFWWVVGDLKIIRSEPDVTLPDWIRNSDSYTDNLFDLDETSTITVLRSAYYLGETFVRSFPGLKWGVGNSDTALQNMPVVRGFCHNLELAPMLVAENVFRKILSGNGDQSGIQTMVSSWVSKTN